MLNDDLDAGHIVDEKSHGEESLAPGFPGRVFVQVHPMTNRRPLDPTTLCGISLSEKPMKAENTDNSSTLTQVSNLGAQGPNLGAQVLNPGSQGPTLGTRRDQS